MRCSAGQSQSTQREQVGQQISRPEPGSTGQSRPERASEAHTSSHLSAGDRSWEQEQFSQKFNRHAHKHRLFGQWKKLRASIVSAQWFLFIKREISCPGTCAVPFFWHPTCVGAHYFSHGPLLTGSPPPPPPPVCHPIKKILESPL